MQQAETANSSRYGYAKLDEEFIRVARNCIIVTPNERLAREHRRTYDEIQLQQGATVWAPIQVQSLSRLFRQLHAEAHDAGLLDRPMLHADQLVCLAQTEAPQAYQDDIATFCDAWTTIHAYDLDIEDPLFYSVFRREFADWFRRVAKRVYGHYVIEEQLPDALLQAQVMPRQPVLFDHIDQLTLPQRRYFAALGRGQALLARNSPGCGTLAVENLNPPGGVGDADTILVGASSLEEELVQAGAWAASTLAADPSALVGIVVPELSRHHALVSRIIGTALDPERGSLSRGYDISGGEPLNQLPMWQDALLFCDFWFDRINFKSVQRLVNSVYLESDLIKHLYELSLRWPNWLGTRISAETAAGAQGRTLPQTPDQSAGDLSSWCGRIYELLQQHDWAVGTAQGSVQYQARQQLQDTLLQLSASNPGTASRLNYVQARNLLNKLLQRRTFAPQKLPSRIQVLGLLESTGLHFSHLWVCGADENRLPAPVRPNRFLPGPLLQRTGVPRSTPAQELKLAQQLVSHWREDSEHTVFSFTNTIDESEQLPSYLVSALVPVQTTHGVLGLRDYPLCQTAGVLLETYLDERGPPLEAPSSSGGTRLIDDQVSCPFRAFATHRLGLSPPQEPTDLPDARQRGSAVHDILQDLLEQYPDSDSLLHVSERVVTDRVQRYFHKVVLPDHFVSHEVQRLVGLVLAWLALEAERAPFQAAALERNFTLDLEHLSINVRIDRLDVVEGKLLVIDYKTGRVSVAGADEIVAKQPQLPLYSLLDENIAGVYYAQVHRDGPKYAGVADESVAISPARHGKRSTTWAQTQQQWRQQLVNLAGEFAHGRAVVSPSRGACAYCHLGNVCRVPEKSNS